MAAKSEAKPTKKKEQRSTQPAVVRVRGRVTTTMLRAGAVVEVEHSSTIDDLVRRGYVEIV